PPVRAPHGPTAGRSAPALGGPRPRGRPARRSRGRPRMTPMPLRLAPCRELPEPDPDAVPLMAALSAGGFAAELVGWDDPDADWDAPVPTILRSTWNYPLAIDAFIAWIDRASASAPLINPPDVVRGNLRKRYLLALAARGVPVVPTTLVESGQSCDLSAIAEGVVIKPEVGA